MGAAMIKLDRACQERFQLHLSTAVLLMLEGSLIVGCNCWRHADFVGSPIGAGFGWPFLFYFDTTVHEHHWTFHSKGFLIDTFVATCALSFNTMLCEWIIRRLKARKL